MLSRCCPTRCYRPLSGRESIRTHPHPGNQRCDWFLAQGGFPSLDQPEWERCCASSLVDHFHLPGSRHASPREPAPVQGCPCCTGTHRLHRLRRHLVAVAPCVFASILERGLGLSSNISARANLAPELTLTPDNTLKTHHRQWPCLGGRDIRRYLDFPRAPRYFSNHLIDS